MQGILLVDKPAEWTSFDVVNYVRRIVATTEGKKPKHVKVGHTGTLDPFATGLLVLLIGKDYTRQAGGFSKLDKTYQVTMKLGETSTTGDPEGIVTSYIRENHQSNQNRHLDRSGEIPPSRETREISRQAQDDSLVPTRETIEEALKRFRGQIEQVPPAYSAIKINGQRAYKLARAGKEVVIEPRQVTIHNLEVTDYSYPEVKLTASVSSGTYIRTLVEDIGQALGSGAYTTQLRRTSVGRFNMQAAVTVEVIAEQDLSKFITGAAATSI
ncbi:MAG TPA: tRNA pseudouridine(55) synthase TruB [Verrucomicrobiae bacterium]|jgi:tRNA pseudouridine55 synthase|nr:tRNA pseudouridine(55) synthase TruB [Verrucomicrobiae bacterium]